jgi:RHS repeat-associated protein
MHPLRIKQGATTAYYELDLAGNVRALRGPTNTDLGGYRYTAFGQTVVDTTTLTQPLRWKARWYSSIAAGTYDVRARQWNPELGLFLSIDEYKFHDRKSTLWSWPGMSPVRLMDPSGRTPLLPPFPSPLPSDPEEGDWCDALAIAAFLSCTLVWKLPTFTCALAANGVREACKEHPDEYPPPPPDFWPRKCPSP